MSRIDLTINGQSKRFDVPGETLLVDLLRDQAGLTGTHIGCDTSQCGACVVRVDGATVKSCTILAMQCAGGRIETIEGIAKGKELHPVQAAFSENHALQCGYCTPGFVITAIDIIETNPQGLDAQTVREELHGNICRCTGYNNIVAAILDAAQRMGVPVQATGERS
ncbi:MAG: carbon monoxide dehydrogenase [Rhizobiales bacterium 62-17]|nr:(2Fe-2S)-binding protein [Hyphomicrobiales bacterium]OJY02142.1 MAG: carbon monoxide dehydrogenase [Rhizobiales bacterium 62-17]